MKGPIVSVAAVLLLSISAAGEPEERPTAAALLEGLASPDYATRRKAVLACEGRDEPALLERLLAMAKDDPHPNIRGCVAEVLSGFRDPRVFDALVAMTGEPTWPGPRQEALVALGRLRDVRAKPLLLAALEDGSVRGYAAKGLGLLGDPETFEAVRDVFLAHPDDAILGELTPAALLAIDAEKGRAALLDAFPTVSVGARLAIARELEARPDAALREAMLRHLDAADASVRRTAIRVLGAAGGPPAAKRLLEHLAKVPVDRPFVAGALGMLGDPSAVPALCGLLGSAADASLRAACAGALGQIRDPRAVAPLVHAVRRETDPLAASRIVEALGRQGDPRAVAELVALLESELVCRQPQTVSSVWTFPWNVRVSNAALWAIRTIRDGKEPHPVGDLGGFPEPPPPDPAALDEVRAWWKKHRRDRKYTLGD